MCDTQTTGLSRQAKDC